jgi:hypothetical protein
MDRDLFQEFNLDKLSEEEQKRFLIKINQIIFKKSMSRAIDKLSEEDRQELEGLAINHELDEKAILDYLREKVVNFEQIVEEEVASFRETSLKLADNLKKNE